jgi:arylsulfatase A-like enzyme
MGRGVPQGLKIHAVHQVDVAATVARLLGISPPRHSEGQPVPGIGDYLLTESALQH